MVTGKLKCCAMVEIQLMPTPASVCVLLIVKTQVVRFGIDHC